MGLNEEVQRLVKVAYIEQPGGGANPPFALRLAMFIESCIGSTACPLCAQRSLPGNFRKRRDSSLSRKTLRLQAWEQGQSTYTGFLSMVPEARGKSLRGAVSKLCMDRLPEFFMNLVGRKSSFGTNGKNCTL